MSCSSAQVSDGHVEAFCCGGDFTIAIVQDGSRGEAKHRQLAERYADLWLQKAHNRRLGEGPKLSMDDAVKAMDAMVMEMAGEAGLASLIAKVAQQEEQEDEGAQDGDEAGKGQDEEDGEDSPAAAGGGAR